MAPDFSVIHADSENFSITSGGDNSPKHEVKTVKGSAKKEVGGRAEIQILRVEEPAARSLSECLQVV